MTPFTEPDGILDLAAGKKIEKCRQNFLQIRQIHFVWLRTGILGTLPSVRVEVRGRVRLSACPAYRRARDHESRRPLRIRQSLKKSELNNLVEGISERSENDNNTKKTIWSGY